MFSALWSGSVLDLAGQTETHTEQPVQSSGATWTTSRVPAGKSRPMVAFDSNWAGAPSSPSGAKVFIRIAACGQAKVHLPQSMHKLASHCGSSVASPRFSSLAVPVGKVPPGGIAETGSRSPSPAISRLTVARVASWVATSAALATTSSGAAPIRSGARAEMAWSIASRFAWTTAEPRLA